MADPLVLGAVRASRGGEAFRDAFSARLKTVRFALAAMAVVVLLRLVWVQLIFHDEFRLRALRQQTRVLELDARRGDITDRGGRTLALSIQSASVFAQPEKIGDAPRLARRLAPVLDRPAGDILADLRSGRPFVWLKRKADRATGERIRALEAPGVGVVSEPRRHYPVRDLFWSVLGFAGTDNAGLDGLELRFDGLLRGRPGRALSSRDAGGRVLVADGRIEAAPRDGVRLETNLDQALQYVAQREVARAVSRWRCNWGVLIAVVPSTGEVVALAQAPAFDVNRYGSAPAGLRKSLAISHAFEPGSTFKLVTAAAAIDAGTIRETDMVFCENGLLTSGEIKVHDHEKRGWLTFADVMAHSSNIGFVKVAAAVGEARLRSMSARFGFGERTEIDLPGEGRGLLRPVERWTRASMFAIPYGQEVSATMLQVVMAYAAVANDGVLMQPWIVRGLVAPDGGRTTVAPRPVRRVVPEGTAARLRALLEGVVTHGTGGGAAVPGFRVAGKTGTAQKHSSRGGYEKGRYVASFVGMVGANRPELAIGVFLDEPKGVIWGGTVAAPVFREFAREAMAQRGLSGTGEAATPPPAAAAPESMTAATGGTAVAVRPAGAGRMPDLRRLTMREVRRVLTEAGGEGSTLHFYGSGLAREQQPPAGAPWTAATPATVRFEPPSDLPPLGRTAGIRSAPREPVAVGARPRSGSRR